MIWEISDSIANWRVIGTTFWVLGSRRFAGSTLGAIQLCGGIFLSVGLCHGLSTDVEASRQNPRRVFLALGTAVFIASYTLG